MPVGKKKPKKIRWASSWNLTDYHRNKLYNNKEVETKVSVISKDEFLKKTDEEKKKILEYQLKDKTLPELAKEMGLTRQQLYYYKRKLVDGKYEEDLRKKAKNEKAREKEKAETNTTGLSVEIERESTGEEVVQELERISLVLDTGSNYRVKLQITEK